MTPVLLGRWQTRVATLGTLGVMVSAIFAAAHQDWTTFFLVLGYVIGLGLGWDVVYSTLQKLRWDRDWPAVFQVANGIVEGIVVYTFIAITGLPGIENGTVELRLFVLHYSVVWLITFVWVQGPMRALFPRWRFMGGRIF